MLGVHSAYWKDDVWLKDAAETLRSTDRKQIDTRCPDPHLGDSAFRLKTKEEMQPERVVAASATPAAPSRRARAPASAAPWPSG